MNSSTPDPKRSSTGDFDDRDGFILIDDEPGDRTVRPPRPEVLKWAATERERLAKLGFNLDGTPIQPPAADAK